MARKKLESDKVFDEWLERNNKRIGEIYVAQVGEYPPTLDNFYGAVINEYVTTDVIRHYVDAIGDRNPLFRDENYAKKTRWGGIIGPPTMTDSIAQPYPFKQQPEEFAKFNKHVCFPYGNRREILKPIRPGYKMKVIHRYLGVTEVETELPEPIREFDEVVRREFVNQYGEVCAIVYSYMRHRINFDWVPERSIYNVERRRPKLTDEERDAIYRNYDNEKRRGAEALYYEDVSLGDKISLHPIGPSTVYDTAAFYTAIAGHAVAFELEWERIKLNPDFHWLDPEVNAWTCGGTCHFKDNFEDPKAHTWLYCGGYAVGFQGQNEGLLGRMLTNWIGDNGFIRLLDTRTVQYPMVGEIFYNSGEVTGKKIEDRNYLVDLKVECRNQDGAVLLTGTAQVQLPSKNDFYPIF
ncbi:MAG: FAS1-like dehydratase domain-containing protein [Oscillospiraceae bacterium]|jgi:acyl dehydratase